MLTGRDDGSLSVLMIGYALIAAVLVVVGVDVSKVFLAQRALSSAADAAALAAAQQIDRAALYAGDGACGALPVDADTARSAAVASFSDASASLRGTFVTLAAPEVAADASTVDVQLHGQVALPLGRIVGVLLPGHRGGLVDVSASASAASAVAGPPDC